MPQQKENEVRKSSSRVKTKTTKKEKDLVKKQKLEAVKAIRDYKTIAESNIVAIFYKRPDLMYDNELKNEDFMENIWKVYWQIAYDIVIKEKKAVLDDVTVGLYLEKHRKLKAKYEEYGGYDTIDKAKEYVEVENISGYISELYKWNTVLKMIKNDFPVYSRISEFADMSVDDIYEEYEAILNHIFANASSDVKSYNAMDGIYDLIEKLNTGEGRGLDFHNCDYLNKEIGGFNPNGHIYGLGANSGVGKSTTVMNYVLPEIIKQQEKVVLFINEEDQTKVQRELIVWAANNQLGLHLQKYQLRDGNFSEETMDILRKTAAWLEEQKENQYITVVPLERYSAKIVVKLIKKYAALGVRYFILDTLKESFDTMTDETYKSMMRDMVMLYDTVKPAAKNVGLFVTYQLGKSSIKLRYLTNNEIGMGKSIVDVMSCNLMIRRPFEDEYEGGKRQITYFKADGKNGTSKVSRTLKRDKHYMITFIPKNRFGETDARQIVSEFDFSTNTNKDVGTCNIMQDW